MSEQDRIYFARRAAEQRNLLAGRHDRLEHDVGRDGLQVRRGGFVGIRGEGRLDASGGGGNDDESDDAEWTSNGEHGAEDT